MNAKYTTLFAMASIAALSGDALAGAKVDNAIQVVTIDDTNHYASGALSTVRMSPDSNEYIACQLISTVNGAGVSCFANSITNQHRNCMVAGDWAAQAFASITADSWIYFSWDTNGQCTTLMVQKGSQWAPKQP
jgi:hypothetical protein